MKLEFYRAALAHPERIKDVEAAFKLANLSGISTDGEDIAGLDTAVAQVVDRYPYLVNEHAPVPVQRDVPLVATASRRNPKRTNTDGYDTAELVKRFQVLARRVGR